MRDRGYRRGRRDVRSIGRLAEIWPVVILSSAVWRRQGYLLHAAENETFLLQQKRWLGQSLARQRLAPFNSVAAKRCPGWTHRVIACPPR